MSPAKGESAKLVNALLRCTRKDTAAAPLFELARADLDVWVMELECCHLQDLNGQIHWLTEELANHREFLEGLRDGGSDYTLHLSLQAHEWQPLRLPARLSSLAHECGFAIEIYFAPHETS